MEKATMQQLLLDNNEYILPKAILEWAMLVASCTSMSSNFQVAFLFHSK